MKSASVYFEKMKVVIEIGTPLFLHEQLNHKIIPVKVRKILKSSFQVEGLKEQLQINPYFGIKNRQQRRMRPQIAEYKIYASEEQASQAMMEWFIRMESFNIVSELFKNPLNPSLKNSQPLITNADSSCRHLKQHFKLDDKLSLKEVYSYLSGKKLLDYL